MPLLVHHRVPGGLPLLGRLLRWQLPDEHLLQRVVEVGRLQAERPSARQARFGIRLQQARPLNAITIDSKIGARAAAFSLGHIDDPLFISYRVR